MSIKDISSRRDVELLVKDFYADVLDDPIIGYIFTDVGKVDLDAHLPVITDFWCSILFKTRDYSGDALKVHQDLNNKLPLRAGHFTRWLFLFSRNVDKRFEGSNADLIKQRAELIAKAMVGRINGVDKRSLELVLSES